MLEDGPLLPEVEVCFSTDSVRLVFYFCYVFFEFLYGNSLGIYAFAVSFLFFLFFCLHVLTNLVYFFKFLNKFLLFIKKKKAWRWKKRIITFICIIFLYLDEYTFSGFSDECHIMTMNDIMLCIKLYL